jgi:hypothetical protein
MKTRNKLLFFHPPEGEGIVMGMNKHKGVYYIRLTIDNKDAIEDISVWPAAGSS